MNRVAFRELLDAEGVRRDPHSLDGVVGEESSVSSLLRGAGQSSVSNEATARASVDSMSRTKLATFWRCDYLPPTGIARSPGRFSSTSR